MAYLKDIYQYLCGYAACNKPAKVELFNHRNAPIGYYCKPHGKIVVSRLKMQEGQEV